jgi:hypothetical protein
VITVLTADGLDHADAIFDFFVAHGIEQMGFNMEETGGENACSNLEHFWQRLQEQHYALWQGNSMQ